MSFNWVQLWYYCHTTESRQRGWRERGSEKALTDMNNNNNCEQCWLRERHAPNNEYHNIVHTILLVHCEYTTIHFIGMILAGTLQ